MSQETFWKLIERSKFHDNQAQWLTEYLQQETISSIAGYELNFRALLEQCHTTELWAAAHLILGGCTLTSFHSFKCWLISMGEAIYNKTLQAPDSLSEIIPETHGQFIPSILFEEFAHVGIDAYYLKISGSIGYNKEIEQSFQNELLEHGYAVTALSDRDPRIEEEQLRRLYPKLWERFGESPLSVFSDAPAHVSTKSYTDN